MNPISRYFAWLQKGNPTGRRDALPSVDANGQTSVPGLYVLGDLTGVPLLKLASESGKRLIDHLVADTSFRQSRSKDSRGSELLDLVIIGGGPAGISAGIEALAADLGFVIIEASRPFSTITNFPKGKPIFAEPEHIEARARLQIPSGTKESLLEDLEAQLGAVDLPIREGEQVEEISKQGDHFIVRSRDENGVREYRALRVALAIGRSGSARMLDIPGEDSPKVYNRLIDPFEHRGEKILVVGGGDSAAETAIALAGSGNHVTLSFRGNDLARAKQGNAEQVERLVADGKISLLPRTSPLEIAPRSVRLAGDAGEISIDNDTVYVMIGREAPLALLRRSGVQIQGEWSPARWGLLAYGILFACVVYFGKKSSAWEIAGLDSTHGPGELFSSTFWSGFFGIPARLFERFADSANYAWYGWRDITIDLAAWTTTLLFLGATIAVLLRVIRRRRFYFTGTWQTFKYIYFAGAAILFLTAFLGGKYGGVRLAGMEPSFWYTFLYSLTILVFGLRRMYLKPTVYIRLQTWTLILIQIIPLFILPEIVLPALWKSGIITPDSWLVANVFPIQSYNNEPSFWRSYGFILAWPLFIYNVFDSNPTLFWIILSTVQTFVIIPLIVWKWGKGAYCGWICSCGGLAETLGDEYRTEAPHGPVAKKWENLGQWILAFIFLLTAAKLVTVLFGANIPLLNLESYTTQGERFYSIAVDLIFAGVLGVGVYFFLSGRIWCRFGCPLAALMHIYARFTKYRIFADKKKCISCNICTTVCHMGIDVMGYANKGIPMNDVECVRCSACIVNCPMDVLSFGELPASDPDNRLYLELPIVQRPDSDWTRGRR